MQFPLGSTQGEVARPPAASAAQLRQARLQEICFVPDGDHRRFIEARGGAGPAGAVVDDQTEAAVGEHNGTHGFTVGQRRGLPASTKRRFVLKMTSATRWR